MEQDYEMKIEKLHAIIDEQRLIYEEHIEEQIKFKSKLTDLVDKN